MLRSGTPIPEQSPWRSASVGTVALVVLDPELRDRVHRQLERVAAVHAVDVLRAVHEVDVRLGPHAVDGIRLPFAQRAARRRHPGRQRRDAGLHQAELREVAAVQRQVEQLPSGDDVPSAFDGLDRQRVGADWQRRGAIQAFRTRHRLARKPGREVPDDDASARHGRAWCR
jgi:hypothetical protein